MIARRAAKKLLLTNQVTLVDLICGMLDLWAEPVGQRIWTGASSFEDLSTLTLVHDVIQAVGRLKYLNHNEPLNSKRGSKKSSSRDTWGNACKKNSPEAERFEVLLVS